MKISLRSDKVVIDGYVNAVDRFSRPLFSSKLGQFVEKVLPNVFKRAIQRAKNIDVLLDHNPDRKLASTEDGTAKIFEDNVGLRAIVEITDAEVVEKARAGKLRGWSFGFCDADDDTHKNESGLIERTIKELNLFEVSIIDDQMLPAYIGTSIEARAVGDNTLEIRASVDTEVDTETEDDTNSDDKTNAEAAAKAEELERQRIQRENTIRACGS